MKPELQAKLTETYPCLYDAAFSRVPFFFDCEDGWYDLLCQLSRKLEPVAMGSTLRALQVKEKFGGLRFYTSEVPPHYEEVVREAIDAAEARSVTLCERCGDEGAPRTVKGWIKTLCEQCRSNRSET